MDITYYAFATYVFLLIVGGAWLLGRVVFRSDKDKGGKSSYEKEQRLFTMYQNLEDMLAGFEELAEETKKSAEEALERSEQALREALEVVEEARRLSRQPQAVEERAAVRTEEPRGVSWSEQPNMPEPVQGEPDQVLIEEEPAPKLIEKEEDSDQVISPLRMNEKIRLLSVQGLTPVEIAKTLGISVREVTLAIEMSRK